MKITDLEKILWIIIGIIELGFLYLRFEYDGITFPIYNIILVAFVGYAIYNRFNGKPVTDSERSSELGLVMVLIVIGVVHIIGELDTVYIDWVEIIICISLLVIGFKNIGQGNKKYS
ncbi:MAG: hypothetical protein MUC49_11565 [Raineya sp.]|jgi:hypothetical protein|nr:hypothetical protein [Raineya sp.]